MGRPPRVEIESGYYHVFNRGVDKANIVRDDIDRKMFFKMLGKSVLTFNIRLFCYCLMNNHFHLFLQTPDANLSKALHAFLSAYAHYFNTRHGRIGPLFQGRFKSTLVTEDSYALELVRYIHNNPIESGVARSRNDYEWSSYPCYTGKLRKWSWLNTAWVLGLFEDGKNQRAASFGEFHENTRR